MTTDALPNLIMGMVDGYTFEKLRPFLVSLRRTGYKGSIVFFCQRVDDETLQKFDDFGVEVVRFRNFMGLFPSTPRKNRWLSRVTRPYHAIKFPFYSKFSHLFLHPSKARFRLYYNYLNKNRHRYNRVLLTDTRDVIFQADPFEKPIVDDLCFFEESFPISSGKYNGPWMRRHLGQDTYDRLKKKTTSCAGTTIGTPSALCHYLAAYLNLARYARRQDLATGDQSLHNAIVYEGLNNSPFNIAIIGNGEEQVYTISSQFDIAGLSRRVDGAIIGVDNEVVPIIHQYDRHPDVVKDLFRLFVDDPT